MKKPVKDIAAWVRRKLLKFAKATNRPFQEVLQYFAMERFLFRLAQSPHADKFVLKGALMFTVWGAPATRPTKDIDFLARTSNTIEAVVPIVRAVCAQPVEPDGLIFDEKTLEGHRIKEDADYEGVRIVLRAKLQNARVAMQLDMGFGDVIVPAPTMVDYPVILELPAPRLQAYSRETMVAEKFEAMVKLGQLNSRMKDFFDIWLLSRQFDFDGPTLARAVSKTFANRKTLISADALALTSAFADDRAKQTQWMGFLKKAQLAHAPRDLHVVIDTLRGFLLPIAEAARDSLELDAMWKAPGPWRIP